MMVTDKLICALTSFEIYGGLEGQIGKKGEKGGNPNFSRILGGTKALHTDDISRKFVKFTNKGADASKVTLNT